MKLLVTGSAGFIGSALSEALLARGDEVIGLDNHNDYYDVSLKEARLARFADIRMYGISLKGGGAIFSPVSALSGSLALSESGVDNSFSFKTISVYEFLNSHTSGNCSLVLNCNGFERPIIESLIIRKIIFKYLIVYFFENITGYDKKLILSEISSAYDFLNIDGSYYIFKIKINLI